MGPSSRPSPGKDPHGRTSHDFAEEYSAPSEESNNQHSGFSIQHSGLNPMMKLSNPCSAVKPESYIMENGPEC
jgi:hypothetical protein